MGSRLVIILDDLLRMLSDSQLKAALHFIDSLGGLIEKATILERKTKAAGQIEVRHGFFAGPEKSGFSSHGSESPSFFGCLGGRKPLVCGLKPSGDFKFRLKITEKPLIARKIQVLAIS